MVGHTDSLVAVGELWGLEGESGVTGLGDCGQLFVRFGDLDVY